MPALDDLKELQKALSQIPREAHLTYIQGYLAAIKDPETKEFIEVALLLGQSLPFSQPKKHIVVLVHGIRTFANWQSLLAAELARISDIEVCELRYEFFDGIRFWCPFLTRRGPINRIRRELREIRKKNPDANISVVAHSFGTYILSKLLREDSELSIYRLQLCGSIIPSRYRWDRVKPQISGAIINDVGTKDYWPLMARVGSWGYGPSGLFGFGTTHVKDNFHEYGHSDFFTEIHMRTYWIPFLVDGQFVQSEWSAKRPMPSYVVSFFSWFPVKSAAVIGLVKVFGIF